MYAQTKTILRRVHTSSVAHWLSYFVINSLVQTPQTGTSAHSLYLTLILVSGAASWSSVQSL